MFRVILLRKHKIAQSKTWGVFGNHNGSRMLIILVPLFDTIISPLFA